jgi:PKD repeat protein
MNTISRIISFTICTVLILITACEEKSKEPPIASFTISTEIARIGETIHFQNTSDGANTFQWDFGDGNGSTEEHPTYIYTENGTYTVKLKVINPDGSDEAIKSLRISYWSTRAEMPTGKWALNTCVVDGKIYAIGGGTHYGKGALGTVEEYDPETDTWSTKSEMPTPRQAPASSVVEGKIYVIGGGESPTNSNYNGIECYATVEEYDPATDTWTEKSPMPTARWCHSTCEVSGRIYIIGGCGSDSYPSWNNSINTMEMYEPATDNWAHVSNLPRPMVNCGSAVIDGKIYIIGGELEGYAQRVDEYDPNTNTWAQKADMPSGKTDAGCSVLNKKIYIMGGDGGTSELGINDLLDIYDPAEDTWTEESPLITPRVGLSSCTVDGKIYAIGGLVDWGTSASNKVEVYYE